VLRESKVAWVLSVPLSSEDTGDTAKSGVDRVTRRRQGRSFERLSASICDTTLQSTAPEDATRSLINREGGMETGLKQRSMVDKCFLFAPIMWLARSHYLNSTVARRFSLPDMGSSNWNRTLTQPLISTCLYTPDCGISYWDSENP
jgi:hypothetical protein